MSLAADEVGPVLASLEKAIAAPAGGLVKLLGATPGIAQHFSPDEAKIAHVALLKARAAV